MHHLIVLLLGLFLAVSPIVYGQQSSYSLLYQLDDSQVQQMAKNRRVQFYFPHQPIRKRKNALVLQQAPLDTLPINQVFTTESLNPGYYLMARVKGQQLLYEVFHIPLYDQVSFIPGKKNLYLFIQDSDIYPASIEVDLDGARIPYDPISQAFLQPGKIHRGLLSIHSDKGTDYYQIADFSYKQRKSFLSPTELSRTGEFMSYRPFRIPFNGYLVFHQARYRPGDTLRLKAFIVDKKGRPYEQALKLHHNDSDKVLTTLIPYRPGVYIHDFVLSDSLNWKLDERHQLSLYTAEDQPTQISQTFDFEDYQLTEAQYSLYTNRSEYSYQDSVQIFAKGLDANGNAMMGSRVELTLKPSQFSLAQNSQIDSLYVSVVPFEQSLPMTTTEKPLVVLPPQLFPPLPCSYSLTAKFLGADNEFHLSTTTFSRGSNSLDSVALLYQWKRDTLLLDHTLIPKPKVLLRYENRIGDHVEKTVQLPYTEKMSTDVSTVYVMKKGEVQEEIKPWHQYEGIFLLKSYSADSLTLVLHNDFMLPVSYSLTRNGTPIEEGITKNIKKWTLELGKKDLHALTYRYEWGGKLKQETEYFPYFKGLLNIEIEGPEKIQPGERHTLRVQVKDALGEPVPGVDVTAIGLNKKFESFHIPIPPYLGPVTKVRPIQSELNIFSKTSEQENRLRSSIFPYFDLDEIAYYRLTHPQGLALHYTSSPDTSIAQFAPFLFHKGVKTPIHFIYLNDQLVYYSGASYLRPYSFIGIPDTVHLRLRTRHAEYRIPNVLLKKGQKLELSFSPKQVPTGIFVRPMLPKLTDEEAHWLNHSMAQISFDSGRDTAYLWQGLQVFGVKRKGLIGPLTYAHLGFALPNKYGRYLSWEPGHIHEISPNKLILRPVDPYKSGQALPYRRYPLQPLGQQVILPTALKKRVQASLNQFVLGHETRVRTSQADAQLYVSLSSDNEEKILLEDNHSSFRNCWVLYPNRSYSLEPGDYRLRFIEKDGSLSPPRVISLTTGKILWVNLELDRPKVEESPEWKKILSSRYPVHRLAGESVFINPLLHQGKQEKVGWVVDSLTKLPIAGAEILLYNSLELLEGQLSTTHGQFQFSHIHDSGIFHLGVLHPDYYPQAISLDADTVFLSPLTTEKERKSLKEALALPHEIEIFPPTVLVHCTLPTPSLVDTTGFFLPKTAHYPIQTLKISQGRLTSHSYPPDKDRVLHQIPYLQWDSTYYKSHSSTIYGRVVDQESGEGLYGATVIIRPYANSLPTGTIADMKGEFMLQRPSLGQELVVSYLGYVAETIRLDNFVPFQEIRLKPAINRLDKIVVRGYSSSTHRNLFKSRSGRNKRRKAESLWWSNPNASVYPGNQDAKDIVRKLTDDADGDGIPDLYDQEPETPPGIAVDAKGISQDLDGDGIPDTRDDYLGNLESTLFPTLSPFRQNFRDNAFWQPNLVTDEQGIATFDVTFPDNITSWNTYILAMNGKKQSGYYEGNIPSFMDFEAQLSVPRFLVEGDSTEIVGRSLLRSTDSIQIHTEFGLNKDIVSAQDIPLSGIVVETQGIRTPTDTDTLQISYLARSEQHSIDGELRSVPVIPKGLARRQGKAYYLESDTSLTFTPDPALGPVYLEVTPFSEDFLLKDLHRLQAYAHSCNEQTASKLLAFQLEKELLEVLDRPFDKNPQLNRLKRRLHQSQNKDGGWGLVERRRK